MAATMQSTRASKKPNKKKKLSKQSVEEFMSGNWDSDTDDLSSEASFGHSSLKKTVDRKKEQKAPDMKLNKIKKGDKPASASSSKSKGMKKSLEDLKDTDPEFYKFLQKEDRDLLEDDDDEMDDDDDSEDEQDSDENEDTVAADPSKKKKQKQEAAAGRAFEKEILQMSSGSDDSEEEGEGGMFQPPGRLEVASDEEQSADEDESEDDDDSDAEGKKKTKKPTKLITPAMVKAWTKQLQSSPAVDVLREVVEALAAASQQAGIPGELGTPYRVEGSKVFNSVVRMCLTEVVPAMEALLKLKSLSDQPQPFSMKNKKWKSLRGTVKNYCSLMLQLCGELSEASMVNVILRHIHKMVVCYAPFPKLAKVFLKKLVSLWSGGEETTRVLAFLCINKLVRLQPDMFLEPTLKQMYMAYVNNCKFVSPTSLPLINFMQRSLVEVFLVQESLAYQHAFLYIRQLAIHLRNAITLQKKEMSQAVYNWQFVLSLGLWSELLSSAHSSVTLQPLVYPLIQVIIGTIRLLPIARYYPLRFHCVRYLTLLSGATNTFVPVLSFLSEVLETTDFNKKLKASGMKSMSLNTILKFSKPQLQEKAFKDAVLDQLCELLWDYLHTQSHTAAFPELIVPLVIQLKDFLKKCKVAAFCKQVKDVLNKAEENAKLIEARRRTCAFNLADTKSVELWEAKNKEEGTPLSKFYASWRKLRDRQLQKDIAGKDQMLSKAEKIPQISLSRGPQKATDEEREEFAGLFGASDSEDDKEDDTVRFLPKGEKIKRREGAEPESDEEDYSDFDSDDLEQLAKSASEDEEEDDSEDSDESAEDTSSKKPKGIKAGKKRKQESGGKSSKVKRGKVEVENDGGDVVQDFDLSDFDSD